MRKKLLSISLYAAIAAGLVSCGGSKDDGTDPVTAMWDSIERADSLREWGPPTAITFANVRDTGKADGMRVTLEGYVTIGSMLYESGTSTSFHLVERASQRGGDYVLISLGMGSGNNEMQSLPDDYQRSDLKLKDDKGNEVGWGDRVRITGIYNAPYSEGSNGNIDLQSFEKIEDEAIDYASLGAEKITIDTNGHGALEGKLVVAEGYLEIPMFVSVTDECSFNLLPAQGSDDYLNAEILVGNGPNMVEDIPDNFAQSDIKVHDNSDALVGSKKVRVYGIWEYNHITVEHIEIIK